MGDAVDIIALDIGTSSTRVAIYKNDNADVVADSDGHRYVLAIIIFFYHTGYLCLNTSEQKKIRSDLQPIKFNIMLKM